MRRITLILLLTGIQILNAQKDLSSGFTLLENGEFDKAETFFKDYLKNTPDDFTAQICYGRAIGLNEKPDQALEHFTKMKSENPKNLEVDLNYAESLLWNQKFEEAKSFYSQLNKEYPNNWKILLGLANTLSNLQEYERANETIQKAKLLEPNNAGILNSQKYIRLGWAYALSKENKWKEAMALLHENQKQYANDFETFKSIFNLHLQQKELKKAEFLIQSFSASSPNEKVSLFEMKSLLAHLQNKNNLALQFAKEGIQLCKSLDSSNGSKSMIQRYIQSLIWNKKLQAAEKAIEDNKKLFSNSELAQLQTQLESYKANFNKVIAISSSPENSNSYDQVMGKLNAYIGAEDFKNATIQLNKAQNLFPNNPDVKAVKNKLTRLKKPKISTQSFFTQDNGKNNSMNVLASLEYPFTHTFKMNTGVNLRNTQDFNATTSQNSSFYFGADWQFHPKWSIVAQINRYQSNSETEFFKWFPSASLKYQLHPLSSVEIGYNEMAENFNTQLAQSHHFTQNYFGIINLYTNYRLGLFAQLMQSNYSDGNTRQLGYGSIYYTLGNKPIFKVAMNYQNMQFAKQIASLYFSPETFSLMEGMMVVEAPILENQPKQWLYLITIGLGNQKIGQNENQFTSRYQAEFGYKFSHSAILKMYGGHTNIATSNASGFALTELGLKFNIIL